ncbi:hypothetical protein BKA64DRAFT_648786 [Cadophora sp. MPI-SDFR-AT-0126]|nr:hypothetical protein BKA64DRAFT_648786 [Leotiomycetes sp. MPI-SDFR-AT-0126]
MTLSKHADTKRGKRGGTMVKGNSTEHRYWTRSKGSVKDVEEITEALELFICELVDPHEELYLQERKLKEMAGFSKLPLELRLMIWKATFPPGRLLPINLETFFLILRPPDNYGPPLPIALHINKESRLEAKKHYYILLPDEVPEMDLGFTPKNRLPPSQRKPLCIDVARDFVYQQEGNWSWAVDLFDLIPGVWDKLEYLVVRLVGFEDLTETEEGLACYPGLKQLTLVQPQIPSYYVPSLHLAQEEQRWLYGNWPKDAEESKAKLLSLMEKRAMSNPARSVPRVTMLPYQQMAKSIWGRVRGFWLRVTTGMGCGIRLKTMNPSRLYYRLLSVLSFCFVSLPALRIREHGLRQTQSTNSLRPRTTLSRYLVFGLEETPKFTLEPKISVLPLLTTVHPKYYRHVHQRPRQLYRRVRASSSVIVPPTANSAAPAALLALNLLSYLPDINQDLFVQTVNVLTSFRFGALPPEIRVIIWRMAMPIGRRFPLASFSRNQPGFLGPRTPITYNICQESRLETMRYFVFLSWTVHDVQRNPLTDGFISSLPLQMVNVLFDPASDVVTSDLWDYIDPSYVIDQGYVMFVPLNDSFRFIRTIEILRVRWCDDNAEIINPAYALLLSTGLLQIRIIRPLNVITPGVTCHLCGVNTEPRDGQGPKPVRHTHFAQGRCIYLPPQLAQTIAPTPTLTKNPSLIHADPDLAMQSPLLRLHLLPLYVSILAITITANPQ